MSDAARKRVAVEIVARHERALQQTARRYSLCAADAEDAYQRALEILLTKAPTSDARELIRWMQTVTKHEALSVRRARERLLSAQPPAGAGGEEEDWAALIPTQADGPAERAERHEAIARSREALQTLKPAELKALTLLAEGYSYAEIGELTGYSRTKINRCLAEGRERFRSVLSRSEDGSRCTELRPLLSAFCDGEASPKEARMLREHLRACAHCRAVMRTYRAAPRAAAALAPLLPASQSIFERANEAILGLQARLASKSGAADSAMAQIATTGGSRGSGMAAFAKLVTVCAGTASSAAACVAVGVAPAPLDLLPQGHDGPPAIERAADETEEAIAEGPVYEPDPTPVAEPAPTQQQPQEPKPEAEPQEAVPVVEEAQSGAVEYTPPPPAPEPAPISGTGTASASSTGSPAGEFGP